MYRAVLARSTILVGILSLPLCAIGLSDARTPDAIALLRGVEQARLAVRSGRFAYRFQLKSSPNAMRDSESARITFAFDGDKRRIVEERRMLVISPPNVEEKNHRLVSLKYDRDEFVRLGLGKWENTRQVTIVNGTEVLATADPMTGATYGDLDMLRGRSFSQSIDPRQLGIGVHGRLDASLERFLAIGIATSITCLGLESVDGKDAWHVMLSLPGDRKAESHLWISDSFGFPVYRMRIIVNGKTTSQVDSEYRQPMAGAVYPNKVRVRTDFDSQNVPRVEFVIEETHGEYGAVIPPTEFNLAGLSLPLGVPVADSRIKQVLGYWDGTRITTDIQAAFKGQPPAVVPSLTWPWYWWTLPSVLLLVIGIWLWLRRRTRLA